MNIGVFDSGLGGLIIFNELIKKLPQYNYVYLGDNARVPYGGRSRKTIYEFTRQAVNFLFKKDCALIVLACNTATAAALRQIQKEYLPRNYPQRRVLGVVRPTVEFVAGSGAKKVGVIATRATVDSKSFIKEIHKLNPNIQVFQNAGPLLVPFIEEGEINTKAFKLVLKKYLQPLIDKKIDTLILGCTHYGLVKNIIKEIVGEQIMVVSEESVLPDKLIWYLNKHINISRHLQQKGLRKYYVTDLGSSSRHNYICLLQKDESNLEVVKL